MAIINQNKPSSSIVNPTDRVVSFETFNSNTTTFNTETRTFDQMGTTMTNTSRASSTITNTNKPT